MKSGYFKFPKINQKYAVNVLKNNVNYNSKHFGINSLDGDGSGVSICVIDTGYPKHKDIPSCPDSRCVDFTESDYGAKDVNGHATGVAGILKANGQIKGIVPQSKIFYAKAISDSGEGEHSAVQASLLFAIVKKVDIIIMSFGSSVDHPLLRDAVRKAYNNGICIFAASGNINRKNREMLYPAKLKESMSVACAKDENDKILKVEQDSPGIAFPFKSLNTTFLEDKYIKMSGASISAPVAAGLAAIIIQNSQNTKCPSQIYNKIQSFCSS